MEPGPILIEETRNGRVQAIHHGHAVLLGRDGSVARAWGDPATSTYWRSAPKALQGIPFALVMDRFGLDDRMLALACASHSGEQEHIVRVQALLAAIGLSEEHLQCGAHPPMTRHSIRPVDGQQPIHNNCSGKHAGMLAACVASGWPVESYAQPDHPLQQEIRRILMLATGRSEIPHGIDGCGLPTFWLPIVDLARVYQWLDRDPTGRRCIDAMARYPHLVAGTDRLCTMLGAATRGQCIGKVGAEGVYVVLHRPTGQAAAVKTSDGTTPAAETVAVNIAAAQGWLDAEAQEGLGRFLQRPVRSHDGRLLGSYETRL